MDKEQLQQLYVKPGYYWGKQPNGLARRVLDYVARKHRAGTLADLGAGEGRDSVFLAAQGFDVLAVDVASNGLAKAERLAEERGVALRTLAADLNDLVLSEMFDVVYSIGTLQYLRPQRRARQFKHFKASTSTGGLHVLFAFVEHPDVPTAPDWGQNEYLYERGELQAYYDGWTTLHTETAVFDCTSSGVPHRHAADILIVAKGE